MSRFYIYIVYILIYTYLHTCIYLSTLLLDSLLLRCIDRSYTHYCARLHSFILIALTCVSLDIGCISYAYI